MTINNNLPVEDNQPEDETRRDFLKVAWGAAGALVLAETGAMALQFFAPRATEGEFGGVFNLGPAADYPPGSVTPVNAGRFYLVRLDDGGIIALYRRCTHLGCAVPWDQAAGQFICPCHASVFEADGDVINPPAPRPLDRFPVTIADGNILVDTGQPIERDHATPNEIVYA